MSSSKTVGFYETKDKAKLYYEVYGQSGPIIVLTYGLACPMNHWHFQIEEFSKTHRVIAYDLRGHQKSSMGSSDISVDLLAKDALDILNHVFPKEKASFWGHSFGVPISLRIASLKPSKVQNLVLINGFFKNPFEKHVSSETCIQVLDKLNIFNTGAPDLTKWIWQKLSDNSLFRLIAGLTGGFNLERIEYKDMEIYTKGVSELDVPIFIEHFKALFVFDGSDYFEKTKCPTLIIHGERDGIVPLDQNVEMSEVLPKAELVLFSEGSHCTQLDLPYDVNQLIKKHASKNKKKLK